MKIASVSPDEQVHLLAYLKNEFKNRCQKNPAYSLRAFSNFLGLDQSNLTKIMKGERRISKSAAQIIYVKFGIRASTILGVAPQTFSTKSQFMTLGDEEFNMIAEWYHFAILELIKIPDFKITAASVAERLNIPLEKAQSALERLNEMGLAREIKGRWHANSNGNTWTMNSHTSEARRLLQKQFLEKSMQALQEVSFEQRDHGSLTVAIRKSRLPEFKEKLRQVRQDLGVFFQSENDADDVYQLAISFFPLTRPQPPSQTEEPK